MFLPINLFYKTSDELVVCSVPIYHEFGDCETLNENIEIISGIYNKSIRVSIVIIKTDIINDIINNLTNSDGIEKLPIIEFLLDGYKKNKKIYAMLGNVKGEN